MSALSLALGPSVVSGLPAHVLLVHLAVVSVPVAALATVAAAAWPAARARLGVATPLVAVAALVCARLTADAGQWLAEQLPPSALLERHEHLGRGLFPWVLALAVVAVLDHVLTRPAAAEQPMTSGSGGTATLVRPAVQHRTARLAVAVVLAVVTAAGSLIQVYRVGDSGARAAWSGVVQASDG